MKALLLYRDRDLDLEQELPPGWQDLLQDLELTTLLEAMAAGDELLLKVATGTLLSSLVDPEEILYRQGILADCLEQPALVRSLYELALEAIAAERSVYLGLLRHSPDTLLSRSRQVLELFLGSLRKLRRLAGAEGAARMRSQGFRRFFAMVEQELSDEYLRLVERRLGELAFRRGVLISARLGPGNKGADYVLRAAKEEGWRARLSLPGRQGVSFTIPERDEGGFRALAELRGRGINLVANAVAQSADHILGFFTQLRNELAFYIGCLNLYERLRERGAPTCFPTPLPPDRAALSAKGLYDACLALRLDGPVVSNELAADGKLLVMVTGANQGGKSTFLRSVGLAQLMMQCGMFVPAESFSANVCRRLFTHFKREEDPTMRSGKLDEELARMSAIAERIGPACMLLCNESFSATNEREGSEIARQVVRAFIEAGVKVVFVTHLFDLAHSLYRQRLATALFLRAERAPDGRRTFRMIEGEPLATSYGQDVYARVFAEEQPLDGARESAGGREATPAPL
jgi:hypothetical protein